MQTGARKSYSTSALACYRSNPAAINHCNSCVLCSIFHIYNTNIYINFSLSFSCHFSMYTNLFIRQLV